MKNEKYKKCQPTINVALGRKFSQNERSRISSVAAQLLKERLEDAQTGLSAKLS
jgi:hypothetical protein